jgi:hypothetical protein
MNAPLAARARLEDDREAWRVVYPIEEVLVLGTYATTARLTLAQLSELLDQLAETGQPDGALVTIDAIGCRVGIADKIVGHKAGYVLALKGNQPTPEADVVDYYRTAAAAELVTKTTVEKGHDCGWAEIAALSAKSMVIRRPCARLC